MILRCLIPKWTVAIGSLLAASTAIWITCCAQPDQPRARIEPVAPPPSTPAPTPTDMTWADQVKPFDFGRPDAVLLFTGGIGGQFEPCDCPGAMRGGLSRLSSLVRAYRARFAHTFLVDTGDAMRNGMPGDPVNEHILRAFKQIGYDAVALGVNEWSLPKKERNAATRAVKLHYLVPLISPSSSAPSHGQGSVSFEFGSEKVSIVSLLSPEAFKTFHESAGHAPPDFAFSTFRDPFERMRKEGHFAVLLADALPTGADSKWIDLWLRTGAKDNATALHRESGVPTAGIGRRSGVAVVALKRQANGETAIAYRLEWLDERWPRDPRLLESYKQYTHDAWEHYVRQERQPGPNYVNSMRCFECHQQIYRAWLKTKHARAYTALVEARRDGDANCLVCHTTGFGTQHGFFSVERTPGLVAVHCQSCHVLDPTTHRANPGKLPKVRIETCQKCHTSETDPHWDTEKRFAAIRCPAH